MSFLVDSNMIFVLTNIGSSAFSPWLHAKWKHNKIVLFMIVPKKQKPDNELLRKLTINLAVIRFHLSAEVDVASKVTMNIVQPKQ